MASPKTSDNASASGPHRRSRRRWTAVALALLLAGMTLSAVGGLVWRADRRRQEDETLRAEAANVTATLSTLLRRNADFVATLRAVLSLNPDLTASGFERWYARLQGAQRQVGGIGTAVVAVVPARQLRAFEARRDRDPAFRALLGHWLTPVAHGAEPRYCLLSAGGEIVPVNAITAPLVQQDWCSPASALGSWQRPIFATAAGSGQVLAFPVALPWLKTLFLEAAFYGKDGPPATAQQRRASVRGWVLSSFDTDALLHVALAQNRRVALSLYHANPGAASVLLGTAGQVSRPAVTVRTSLAIDGRWLVVVRAAPLLAGPSPAAEGWWLFAGGSLVSVLLALLVLTLARSRDRALAMVAEKTGQLRHQALHDALTGLPNRVLALDRAEQMLARARRAQSSVAALYLDIDGFKQINDTFGHQSGDEFLRLVADRLSTVIRESDTAARLSGDEFLVLLDVSTLEAGAELVAERLLDVLREPYELGTDLGRPVRASASIGVAYGNGGAEPLVADADVALYAAKQSGKDRYVIFESTMRAAAQDRVALGLDVACALDAGELFLVYQPTFDLHSERITGVEALLRWRHPERGLVPPDAFIPLAEASGQIVRIGRWVLNEACRQAADWHGRGRTIGVSVNVSGRQLESDEFLADVACALETSGLDPAALTLEITETVLMHDTDVVAERLRELKNLGVRVAIDDFGTGYSSLAYLRQFPIDALKIDRSFISALGGSPQSLAVIRALVQLGKTLGLETLAEGIEEQSQLRQLQREHCDHGQGFLLARPLAVEAIDELLEIQLEQPA